MVYISSERLVQAGVQYECLSTICHFCGCIGHRYPVCAAKLGSIMKPSQLNFATLLYRPDLGIGLQPCCRDFFKEDLLPASPQSIVFVRRLSKAEGFLVAHSKSVGITNTNSSLPHFVVLSSHKGKDVVVLMGAKNFIKTKSIDSPLVQAISNL